MLQVNSCSLPPTDSPSKAPGFPSPASALEASSSSGTRERSSSLLAALTSLCPPALLGAAALSPLNLPTTPFTQESTNVLLSSLTVPKCLPDSISLSSVSQIFRDAELVIYTSPGLTHTQTWGLTLVFNCCLTQPAPRCWLLAVPFSWSASPPVATLRPGCHGTRVA